MAVIDDVPRRPARELSGSVFMIASDGRVLSLPIPSRSRHDPLNWCPKKRHSALFAAMFFAIIGLVQVQAPALMMLELRQDFTDKDMAPFHLDALVSSPTLFLGIGAFLWIPLSLAVGRRPVFLLCTVIMIFATLWAGISGSFHQLLVALCLQGFALGIYGSTMLLMVIDLTFIHQRPQAIAAFWSLTAVVSQATVGTIPLITKTKMGWRAFYIAFTILSFIAFLLAFFLYPETFFVRPALAFDGHVLVQSGTENVVVYEGWDDVPGGKELPETPEKSKLREIMKGLRVWGTVKGGWKAMAECYPQIMLCAINPLIFWVALLNAAVFASMISIGATYATLLSNEPYKLSLQLSSLINVSAAVGALLAWPVSGIMVARITRRLAIRNGGVRDAEHYLPAFILPILSAATSVIIYGMAGERKWHWMWIHLASALNSFSSVSLGTANTLWVTEAFPRWASAALVVVGGGSYMASFGMSFGIVPWIKSQGFAGENIEVAAVILVIGGVLIPISFWGKRLRQHIDLKWGKSNKRGAVRPQ